MVEGLFIYIFIISLFHFESEKFNKKNMVIMGIFHQQLPEHYEHVENQ